MADPVPTPVHDPVIPPDAPPDPNAPIFVVTNAQWEWAKQRAGKMWPTIQEYWPMLTAALLVVFGVGAGTAHLATKSNVDPAPAPPAITVDFKPVVDAVSALGMEIKKSQAEIKTELDSVSKKLDSAPSPTDPVAPPVGPFDPSASAVLPATVEAKIGRQTTITAKATGDVYWIIPPSAPCDADTNGNKVTIVPHAEATTFSVGVFAQVKGKWTITWTMVKAGAAPQPPPPPTPANPLVSTLQAAYITDGKLADRLSKLIAVYDMAPAIINNPANKTPKSIVDVNSAAITNAIEPGAPKTVLLSIRTVIDQELRKTLPLGPASAVMLDDNMRKLFVSEYAKIATALKGIQP